MTTDHTDYKSMVIFCNNEYIYTYMKALAYPDVRVVQSSKSKLQGNATRGKQREIITKGIPDYSKRTCIFKRQTPIRHVFVEGVHSVKPPP